MFNNKKVFIIAEAGVNHNGNIEVAKKLIYEAALAGADAIKFQTYKAENIVRRNAPKAKYQIEATGDNESQFEMLKHLELTAEMHRVLFQCCKEKNILFLSTPFDEESLELLEQLKLPLYKVASGEITNYPLLGAVGKTGKPVILSTGMSEMEEIQEAIGVLKENGTKEIILLHCNTQYPTPYEDVNLKAMVWLRKESNLEVGYSDHTLGIEVPIAAVALGAKVIEKHFTLDKSMKGPDHKASLNPNELKQMVVAIRNIENALGVSKKRCSLSEILNREVVRKSIVAKQLILKGEILNEENITTKRPGNGISPMNWEKVIGTRASKQYEKDDLIE